MLRMAAWAKEFPGFSTEIEIPCDPSAFREFRTDHQEEGTPANAARKHTKQTSKGTRTSTRLRNTRIPPKLKRTGKVLTKKTTASSSSLFSGLRSRAKKADSSGPSTAELTPAPKNEDSPAGKVRKTKRRNSPQSPDLNGAPIVSICRRESFSAAHRLHNSLLSDEENRRLYGKCNNKNGHGHNYTVKVTLRGPVDANTGMVYNLADLKEQMKAVLDRLDHKNLDKDVSFFKKHVSTVENIVHFISTALREQMDKPELLHKVKVLETENNAASIVC